MQTQQLPSIELGYCEGSSDKIYRACIEKSGDGFVVNFAYGRRGSTLNTGSKTQQPVSYAEALDIYEKLVRSKTTKGYKPTGGSEGAIAVSVAERQDSGLRAQLLNPIDEDDAEAFLSDDAWCAQEKFDGRRMLIRKAGNKLVAVNRDGLHTGLPQAYADALAAVRGDFVLDGESVGETLYAFDLLENLVGDLRGASYRVRLNVLQRQFGGVRGGIVVADTARGRNKRAFMQALKAAGKEGVVFKHLDAEWSQGRPASGGSAMKCKFWATCSCVVLRLNARRSVELELGGRPVGNVTIPPNHDLPAPGQVVEIRYLYVTGPGGALYQPVYLGVRDDVRISDCTFELQRLKYKAA